MSIGSPKSARSYNAGAGNSQTLARQGGGEPTHRDAGRMHRNDEGLRKTDNGDVDVADAAEIRVGIGDRRAAHIQVLDLHVGGGETTNHGTVAAAVAEYRNARRLGIAHRTHGGHTRTAPRGFREHIHDEQRSAELDNAEHDDHEKQADDGELDGSDALLP